MTRNVVSVITLALVAGALTMALAEPAAAQAKPKAEQKPAASSKAPASAPSAADKAMMDAMMKAMAPGENHKLLASLAGDWTFSMKMATSPSAPPTEYTGTSNYTAIMGGRYVQNTVKGLMMGMPFEGMGFYAYDNLTKRFEASWMDNFGTALMKFTGTYDPATKTLTFRGDEPDMLNPATTVKVRQTIRLVDANKHVMEWYETRGGKETKTMEITTTRKK